jgi:DNA-binding NtrC family response regulator
MGHGNILAIDDEKNIRHLIKNEFALEGFKVTTASDGEEGLKIFDDRKFDVVLLDIKLPGVSGIETLRKLKQKSSAAQVIMITGHGDIKSAVECIKLGARDYVTKPFKLDELISLARKALEDNRKQFLLREKISDPDTRDSDDCILCPSRAMQEVYGLVKRIAPTDNTVLIQGETGVGKDVLAMLIHRQSSRKSGPFITLDCGLLNKNLAESELYGHRKGAFSGASEGKLGLVEKSQKGTLFLDEIGNIDLELQKKFLRFLETKRFRRIGETGETQVDTRIILATNMNLQDAIQKGTMRQDLFYRMDVLHINVPPLRERPEDTECLVKHFLRSDVAEYGPKTISPEAMCGLSSYSWPGNVRELKSVINKAVIFAESDIVMPGDLPPQIALNKNSRPCRPKSLEDIEKEHILAVLEETGGNQSKASKILGINRKTLYKKIHKYEIFS